MFNCPAETGQSPALLVQLIPQQIYLVRRLSPVFGYFPDIPELLPELGGFEVVAGGSQSAVHVAVTPGVTNLSGGDQLTALGDGPVYPQRPDDEVDKGNDRSQEKQHQDTEEKIFNR